MIDVGTSSVRAGVVRPDATVANVHRRSLPPTIPAPGLVELDPGDIARAAIDTAGAALAEVGHVEAVAITAQRASAIVWDGRSGEPLGPGLGWQDLRTAGTCLELQAEGVRFSPSESATKFAWLLDRLDSGRRRYAKLGTVDSWVAWNLSGGRLHITDPSNAGVTGLFSLDGGAWREDSARRLAIEPGMLTAVVDSSGLLGEATALP
ncbi:MAG: FGGY family carbohydrate kinase, partial [Acidimicrobiales bacterium]